MMFMETRITETVPPQMYFKGNDYIDDGGMEDPGKEGGSEEDEDGEDDIGGGPVSDPNGDDDDAGSIME